MTGGWTLIYSIDGISGHEKPVAGTEMKEFKADGFAEARMEVIGEILRVIPSCLAKHYAFCLTIKNSQRVML